MAFSLNKRVIELHDTDSPVIDLDTECGERHALDVANKLLGGAVSTRQDVDFGDPTRGCGNNASSGHAGDARERRFNFVYLGPLRADRTEIPIHHHGACHQLTRSRIPNSDDTGRAPP